MCAWGGSGGQVSIGSVDQWARRRPHTRLVVTGVDPSDRDRVAEAFATIVMSEQEYAARARWAGRDDGFDPWLGVRTAVA